MTFPRSVPFSRHSENLSEVKNTIVQLQRLHKAEIRSTGSFRNPDIAQPSVLAIRRVHLLLVGIMAEATLKKVIADPTGFSDQEREIIWGRNTQELQWRKTVELAFRRHYGVASSGTLNNSSLGAVPNAQRLMLLALIRDQLQPVITDRNKIAHANWIWQLKSQSNDEFVLNPRNHATYDYCRIEALNKATQALGALVYLLAVSEPTFQRDYDKQLAIIERAKFVIDDSASSYKELCDFLSKIRRS